MTSEQFWYHVAVDFREDPVELRHVGCSGHPGGLAHDAAARTRAIESVRTERNSWCLFRALRGVTLRWNIAHTYQLEARPVG